MRSARLKAGLLNSHKPQRRMKVKKNKFGFDFKLRGGFLCLHWSPLNVHAKYFYMPWKWYCYVSKDATPTNAIWLFGFNKYRKLELAS
jgi:hypothetical protein